MTELPTRFLAALFLAACSGSPDPPPAAPGPATPATAEPTPSAPASPASPTTVMIAESDFGGSVHAMVGDRIQVEVAGNATTGYEWRFSWEPSAALAEIDNQYIASPSGKMVGSGGVQRLLVEARAAGQVVLQAQYGRWWQGGEREPPKTVTLAIDPRP